MKHRFKKTILRIISAFTALSAAAATGCSNYTGDEDIQSIFLFSNTFEASLDNRDQIVPGNEENSSQSSMTQNSFIDPSFTQMSGSDAPENSFTLMVYLCGSDLEKDTGAATKDIFEMIAGCGQNNNVNIIIETGGSGYWQNNIVSAERCQRYRLTSSGMILIDDSLGQQHMGMGKTLTDFISFAAEKYPAQRYGLILWDHGGGSVGGWCYDENYAIALMSLPELYDSLAEAGIKYDFIGFDACLMGGIETCVSLAPFTDRLIASEEPSPNCGWFYTDFIAKLFSDPAVSADELGKLIVDSYIDNAYKTAPYFYSTLGVFDTQKITSQVMPSLNSASISCNSQLNSGSFSELSLKRSGMKEMTDAPDYVDLYSFAETEKNYDLIDKLNDATVYFKATDNFTGDHGLNIYYPYHELSLIDNMDSLYTRSGVTTNYSSYIHSFANVMAGGKKSSESSTTEDNYSEYDWYDDTEAYSSDYYDSYNSNSDINELEITKRNDNYVLDLSDDDRDIISKIELVCMIPFDDGFLDLGTDDYYQLDEEDDLIVGYDQTWIFLDGELVPFHTEESFYDNDRYISYGYVPCQYNGVKSQLLLVWSSELPDGFVAGVRPVYDDDVIANKGVYDLKDGDTFQVLFDFYDKDMNYLTTMPDDRVFTVNGELKVSYEDISSLGDTYIFYRIYDIFNNVYNTESVTYNITA